MENYPKDCLLGPEIFEKGLNKTVVAGPVRKAIEELLINAKEAKQLKSELDKYFKKKGVSRAGEHRYFIEVHQEQEDIWKAVFKLLNDYENDRKHGEKLPEGFQRCRLEASDQLQTSKALRKSEELKQQNLSERAKELEEISKQELKT